MRLKESGACSDCRLQPASWGEGIELHIQHVPLGKSQRIGVMLNALMRVQATLPPGWTV